MSHTFKSGVGVAFFEGWTVAFHSNIDKISSEIFHVRGFGGGVGDDDSDSVGFQHFYKVFVLKARVTKFEGVTNGIVTASFCPNAIRKARIMIFGEFGGMKRVVGEEFDEFFEAIVLEGDSRWKLPENRSQFLLEAEKARRQKTAERFATVFESKYVGDKLRTFNGEDKIIWSLVIPTLKSARLLKRIESSIDFDGSDLSASIFEFFFLGEFFWIKPTAPSGEGPT